MMALLQAMQMVAGPSPAKLAFELLPQAFNLMTSMGRDAPTEALDRTFVPMISAHIKQISEGLKRNEVKEREKLQEFRKSYVLLLQSLEYSYGSHGLDRFMDEKKRADRCITSRMEPRACHHRPEIQRQLKASSTAFRQLSVRLSETLRREILAPPASAFGRRKPSSLKTGLVLVSLILAAATIYNLRDIKDITFRFLFSNRDARQATKELASRPELYLTNEKAQRNYEEMKTWETTFARTHDKDALAALRAKDKLNSDQGIMSLTPVEAYSYATIILSAYSYVVPTAVIGAVYYFRHTLSRIIGFLVRGLDSDEAMRNAADALVSHMQNDQSGPSVPTQMENQLKGMEIALDARIEEKGNKVMETLEQLKASRKSMKRLDRRSESAPQP